ncbi:methyltransferase domain-containing protein, partial [Patescibacteria group bacterium]|nr:methyltransferase domain-containing protein [Patescibacteria group bacterium]
MIRRLLGKQWVFEGFLPGENKVSLEGFVLKKKLFSTKTKYQKLDIFDTEEYGRMLFLDDMIQLSTKHEATYHEMLVHPALLSHPDPKDVLIIGGGDGGALREAVKHPKAKVSMVEIDREVVAAARKYLPSLSNGAFDHPRARVIIGDGEQFIKEHKDSFDCIILDSNDPDGVMAGGFFHK